MHLQLKAIARCSCRQRRSMPRPARCRRVNPGGRPTMGVSHCARVICTDTAGSSRQRSRRTCSIGDVVVFNCSRPRHTRISACSSSSAVLMARPSAIRVFASGRRAAVKRHAFVFQAGTVLPKVGSITLFARVQSGLPFTPLVQGDINGDGRANDRAFLPSRGGVTDPALSTQLRALLDVAPSNVRDCLERQLGSVAARNSCRGAWTQSLNVQWQPRIPIKVQGRAIVANVALQNPLGGFDGTGQRFTMKRGWNIARCLQSR